MIECDICEDLIDEDEATTMEPVHDAPTGVVCSKMSCVMEYMMRNASWEREN